MIKGFLFIFIFTSFLASSIDGQNYIDTIFCGEYKIYDVNSLVTKIANKVDFICNKNHCVAAVGAMKEDVSLEEFVNIFKALDYGISGEGIVNGDFINYIEVKGYSLNSLCELEDILSNLTEGSHTDEVCSEKGGFHDVLITRIRAYENGNLKFTFKNPQVGTIKAYNINYKDFNNSWGIFQFSDKMLLFYILSDICRLYSMNINEDEFIEMYNKYFNSFNPIETLKYIKEKRSKDKIFRKNNMDSLEIVPILNFSIDETCFEKMNYSYNTDTFTSVQNKKRTWQILFLN